MVVGKLNNSLAFAGLWVCLVLISIKSTEAVDSKCPREYFEGIGCISLFTTFGGRCSDRWFCDHLKNFFDDDVTCLVNGRTYRRGQKFKVPNNVEDLVIECTCDSGYPETPDCTYTSAYFVQTVLNRVNNIKSRTGGD